MKNRSATGDDEDEYSEVESDREPVNLQRCNGLKAGADNSEENGFRAEQMNSESVSSLLRGAPDIGPGFRAAHLPLYRYPRRRR